MLRAELQLARMNDSVNTLIEQRKDLLPDGGMVLVVLRVEDLEIGRKINKLLRRGRNTNVVPSINLTDSKSEVRRSGKRIRHEGVVYEVIPLSQLLHVVQMHNFSSWE